MNKSFMKSPFEDKGVNKKLQKLLYKLGNKNLNLIPSENILTETVRRSMFIEAGNRYHLPTDFTNVEAMPSRKQLYKYLLRITNDIKNMYGCSWCDLRPISGINNMMIVMGAFRKKAKNFLCLGRKLGGHSVTLKLAESFGYKVDTIPDKDNKIDLDRLKTFLQKEKETLIYLDHSICLDIIKYQDVLNVLKVNDILFYDISHLNIFWLFRSSPSKDGRFVFGGTFHKTFPGPQKAFLGMYINNENTKLLKDYLKLAVSSAHTYNFFALDLVIDSIKKNGFKYMQQIVKNANFLGKELSKEYEVFRLNKEIFTNSHQIWIKTDDFNKFTEDCAKSNISVYRSYIPPFEDYGMRLGVQEVTYMGMTEEHMKIIAQAIVLANKRNQPIKARRLIQNLINEAVKNG